MSETASLGPAAEDRFGIVGRVIAGAYHVERVVAEGGFGVVYRAQHGGFRAPIALKCLKVPQHLSSEHQARFLEQFRAEAEVMFRLSASTPSVVRPLHVDAMTTPNGAFVPFLVLEWLEGETLDAIIRGRRNKRKPALSLRELMPLLEPVALALDRAHHFDGPRGKETIVHCDLKPENVFVAEVGGERVVKILDFGVAKVRSAATRAGGTAESVSLFTPAYGAPEQWNPGELGEAGPWTDVWGLALTGVEALVGEPVIAGDHTRVMRQVLDRVRRPTPRTFGVALPNAVEAVFARAMAVDPRERHRDAGSFWKALRDAVGEAEAAERAQLAPQVIPDLVPVSRRSVPERPSGSPSLKPPAGEPFDFEDVGTDGPVLALDLPPDEPLHRRSLTPPGLSIPVPPAASPIVAEPAIAPPFLATTPRSPQVSSRPDQGPPAERGASDRPSNPRVSAPPARPSPMAPASPAEGSGDAAPGDAPRLSHAPAAPAPPPPPTLARRLAPGIAMAGASVLLTILDHVYAAVSGEVFSLGPLRTTWIAGLLLVGGIALVAVRLLPKLQDDR